MKVASSQTLRKLSSLAAKTDCLAGTVPLHQAYILLHGRHSPRTFPSQITSPLLSALRRHALRWSALVNVAWIPSNAVGNVPNPLEDLEEVDTYNLLAFSRDRARLRIPSVAMDNLEDAYTQLNDHMKGPPASIANSNPDGFLSLYVCTHCARDCRCGEWGSKVADALREEVRKRKEIEPTGKYSRVVVGEVGHVGGHQHAANMIVFPHGEWLGNLRPDDAPRVLDVIVGEPLSKDLVRTPLVHSHWRGRMGLTKDEQLQQYLLHRDSY